MGSPNQTTDERASVPLNDLFIYLLYVLVSYLINQHTMWVKSLTLFFAASLLLLKVTEAQESWSWGTDSSDDSDTTAKEAPASAATTAVEAPQDVQGRDGRFLGITDKLCELGLGVHCKKKPHG